MQNCWIVQDFTDICNYTETRQLHATCRPCNRELCWAFIIIYSFNKSWQV